MLSANTLSDLADLGHCFLTRQGGVSEGLFASLNCGLGSGDNQALVMENRRRALIAAGIAGAALVTLYQIHSATVVEVTEPWSPGEGPRADAVVTRRPGIALGILTADCAPVLFADARAGIIGAAHAGWRGALSGVLEATIAAMMTLGAQRTRIVAAIGPCIHQASYQVGPEFPAPFLAQDGSNARFFDRGPGDRQRFDLAGYAAARLEGLGLRHVALSPADTCAEAERFFSYRRATLAGESDYGRNLSVIALKD
jgi:hypothetical protein